MADSKADQGAPASTPPIPSEKTESGENSTVTASKSKRSDAESVCESKRRKSCPSALCEFEAIKSSSSGAAAPSASSFSFTFATKIRGSPEHTPKFGSFNFPEQDRCGQISAKLPAKEEKKDDGEDGESRREIVGVQKSTVD